jgi:hypothetical protein
MVIASVIHQVLGEGELSVRDRGDVQWNLVSEAALQLVSMCWAKGKRSVYMSYRRSLCMVSA